MPPTIAPPDSTLAAIQTKIRRLTVSPSEQALSTSTIQQAINTFYQQDFPYGIKLDQMRSVYTFYTTPNVDRYPLNVNFNQGVRNPVYFEGIQGFFYKDRQEFYALWPRWPTQSTLFTGDGTTQSYPDLTVNSNPFLPHEVTLGGLGTNGEQIIVSDDGYGNMMSQVTNPVVSNPVTTSFQPGMKNTNLSNQVLANGINYQTYPGDNVQTNIGTVDYVTGEIELDFSLANVTPAQGAAFTLWVSNYQPGRSYSLLFWNNEFTVRPVPDFTYKVEVETYLTPVQFLNTTDNPILTQWWQYLAYGAAMEILRERQDFQGVENLREGFLRQEGLVLERQGVEEIGQRNATIFSESTPQQGWNQGYGWPY
jgi:hypothetical protein